MRLLKYKDQLIHLPTYRIGMAGFYKFHALHKFSGHYRELTPWFPNILLTNGLNNIPSQADWMQYCRVGSANNAPAVTDTSLYSQVASTNSTESDTTAARASSPYYGYRQVTYRFPQGSFSNDNIQEVGVGWGSTGSTLVSRALPINEFGESITPTVLSDEILDVTYQMRYYAPTSDETGTVTLDGTTYNTTTRAALATNGNYWGQWIGWQMGAVTTTSEWLAYDGNIGNVTQGPSGTSASLVGTVSNQSYSNNSFELDMQADCGTTGWNLGSGIRSIRIATRGGAYQTEFSAQGTGNTIPKTTSYTMQMVWTVAWSGLIIFPAAAGTYTVNGLPVDFTVA